MTLTALPAPPAAPRRRHPLWLRILLWSLVLTAGIFAAGLLWLVVVFSGGLDDLLDVRQPSPDDRRVVEARERSEQRLAEELEAITGTAPSAADSECVEGQHNWKIDDPYDLLCTQSTGGTLRLGARGHEDEAALLRLHDRLVADGWQYSGHEAGQEDRSSLARMVPEYGASSFPAASYRRDGVELVVEPTHRGLAPPYGWPGAVAPVPEGQLAVLVLLREDYFSG